MFLIFNPFVNTLVKPVGGVLHARGFSSVFLVNDNFLIFLVHLIYKMRSTRE